MPFEGEIMQASHDVDVDVDAVVVVDGIITTPAVLSTKLHANLRVFSGCYLQNLRVAS